MAAADYVQFSPRQFISKRELYGYKVYVEVLQHKRDETKVDYLRRIKEVLVILSLIPRLPPARDLYNLLAR